MSFIHSMRLDELISFKKEFEGYSNARKCDVLLKVSPIYIPIYSICKMNYLSESALLSLLFFKIISSYVCQVFDDKELVVKLRLEVYLMVRKDFKGFYWPIMTSKVKGVSQESLKIYFHILKDLTEVIKSERM